MLGCFLSESWAFVKILWTFYEYREDGKITIPRLSSRITRYVDLFHSDLLCISTDSPFYFIISEILLTFSIMFLNYSDISYRDKTNARIFFFLSNLIFQFDFSLISFHTLLDLKRSREVFVLVVSISASFTRVTRVSGINWFSYSRRRILMSTFLAFIDKFEGTKIYFFHG